MIIPYNLALLKLLADSTCHSSAAAHMMHHRLHAQSQSACSGRHCITAVPTRPHVRCRAVEPGKVVTAAAESAKIDPFAPENKVTYSDGPLDKIFMKLFTQKIADQLEPGTFSVPSDIQYEDFVRVSKEILRGRATQEQHALVRRVLVSLVPPGVPAACKALFRPTQWAAEVNAAVASWGFFWLVGDSELRSQGVEVAPGVLREQRSVVHIKKCRYLEASGCVGLCVNMCKVPTQSFFTNDFGMPLTMNPNFEDLSCEMVFGQAPPPLEQDPVHTQSCFVPHCSLADRIEPCPKTDTERVKARQQIPAAAAAAVGAGGSGSSSNGSSSSS